MGRYQTLNLYIFCSIRANKLTFCGWSYSSNLYLMMGFDDVTLYHPLYIAEEASPTIYYITERLVIFPISGCRLRGGRKWLQTLQVIFSCDQEQHVWHVTVVGYAFWALRNLLYSVFVLGLALGRLDEFSIEWYERIFESFLFTGAQPKSRAMGFSGRKSPRSWSCLNSEVLEFSTLFV